MAVRIQLRRDTAANWVANNPTLREGELGIETDTLKIKVGNGSAWNSTSNYANVVPSDLNTTLGDYVLVEDIGAAGGVVGLDNSKNAIITGSSIIIEGSTDNTYETTLTVTDPTADRTITLPNATGTVALTSDITTAVDAITTDVIEEGSTNKYFTDERAQDAVAQALANGTHTNITVGYNDGSNAISLTGAVTYTDENAQDAVGNAVGTGLSYNDSTGAISVDTATIQARVADVSDTEIGYLNGVTSSIQTQIDTKAPINNPTFTGTVTLPGAPSTANEAATKAYVDNITAGLNFHAAVHVATTTDLSATYNNGAGTLSASGTFPTIDGETITETQRVLVKSQTDAKQNGIYELTDDGDPSGTWILTRSADANNTPAGEVAYGDFVFVQTGATNGGYGYTMTTTGTITLGTSNIVWTQFNAGQSVTAGNGLSEPTAGTLAINTAITADLSTAQTLTNKTLTSPTITGTGAIAGAFTGNLTGNVTGDVSGNAGTVTNGVYTNAANTITAATSSTKPLVVKGAESQSANIQEWQNSSGTVLASVASTGTIKSGAFSSPTDLGSYINFNSTSGAMLVGLRSAPDIGMIVKGASSQSANLTEWQDSSGTVLSGIGPKGRIFAQGKSGNTDDLFYLRRADNNIQLRVDYNGILTGNFSAAITQSSPIDSQFHIHSGSVTRAALSLGGVQSTSPTLYIKATSSQTSDLTSWVNSSGTVIASVNASGQFVGDGSQLTGLTTALTTPSTVTLTANTATTVDTTALSAFTSLEYMVSIKQGSKVRTSKVVVQTDGTSVDMTEFAITETGGTISGVVVSAAVSATDAVLQATVTDATTTNAIVKLAKIKL